MTIPCSANGALLSLFGALFRKWFYWLSKVSKSDHCFSLPQPWGMLTGESWALIWSSFIPFLHCRWEYVFDVSIPSCLMATAPCMWHVSFKHQLLWYPSIQTHVLSTMTALKLKPYVYWVSQICPHLSQPQFACEALCSEFNISPAPGWPFIWLQA